MPKKEPSPLERDDVARAPCGPFAAEMHLEHRYHVEEEYVVLCAAWSIRC